MQIAIIGAGNIGLAITRGLVQSRAISANDLFVVDVKEDCLSSIKKINPAIKTTTNSIDAVSNADIIILSVKPWLIDEVLDSIKIVFDKKKQMLLSVAAGVCFDTLEKSLGEKSPLFRIMPNTAISIGESMTLISAKNTTEKQENEVLALFAKLGKAFLIKEEQMTAATSVASCGIAYALRYLRAAAEGAVELGIHPSLAHEIVAQTMRGAAELILQNNNHPEIEIDKVTTPGGWTIKGLNAMEKNGFTKSVIAGLIANS